MAEQEPAVIDSTLVEQAAALATIPAPCTDCPMTEHEILVRWQAGGAWRSYAVDYEVMGQRIGDAYADVAGIIPRIFRPILEGALFALRHGPLQKFARDMKLDTDPYLKVEGDKDALTIRLLYVLIMRAARGKQFPVDSDNPIPLDVGQGDLVDAYRGVVRRVEQYDGIPHVEQADEDPLLGGAER